MKVVRLTRHVSAEDTATLLEPFVGLVVQAPEGFAGVDGWLYVEREDGGVRCCTELPAASTVEGRPASNALISAAKTRPA